MKRMTDISTKKDFFVLFLLHVFASIFNNKTSYITARQTMAKKHQKNDTVDIVDIA